MGIVREPQKVTSIEKKKKIIEAGLKVFGKKGYYNTNTAEIAKVAGVSTGIVYSYFNDKKDILLQVIELYFQNIFQPIQSFLFNLQNTKLDHKIIEQFLQIAIKSHQDNYTLHEEVIALSHLDKDVHKQFLNFEILVSGTIEKILLQHNVKVDNITERVHLAYNIVENLCHECVYHKHANINYNAMISLTTKTLLSLFN
jgi:AcrR family transcriptional regulator